MRLIDADEFLEKNAVFADLDFHHPLYEDTLRDLIDDAPTVDAVPVVRCKDCKWRGDEYNCPMVYKDEWYDDDDGWDFKIVDQAEDDGFCHKGERDDVNND